MLDTAIQSIALHTLGALRRHSHGLFGWCRDCAANYRRELLPVIERPAGFDIDLRTLIAERGTDCLVLGMAPVPCPGCGSRRTVLRITAPSR